MGLDILQRFAESAEIGPILRTEALDNKMQNLVEASNPITTVKSASLGYPQYRLRQSPQSRPANAISASI